MWPPPPPVRQAAYLGGADARPQVGLGAHREVCVPSHLGVFITRVRQTRYSIRSRFDVVFGCTWKSEATMYVHVPASGLSQVLIKEPGERG